MTGPNWRGSVRTTWEDQVICREDRQGKTTEMTDKNAHYGVQDALSSILALSQEIDADAADITSETSHYAVHGPAGWAYIRSDGEGFRGPTGSPRPKTEKGLSEVIAGQDRYGCLDDLCRAQLGVKAGHYTACDVLVCGMAAIELLRGRPQLDPVPETSLEDWLTPIDILDAVQAIQ